MWEQLHSTIIFSKHLKSRSGLSVHWLVYLEDHFYPEGDATEIWEDVLTDEDYLIQTRHSPGSSEQR